VSDFADIHFPSGFLWGCATSSHQIEGNCTNNDWWAWEQEGGHIRDGDVSGLACDHYNRFDEDFALAQELGHNAHRLSIEWSRVEPEEGRWDARATR
jgi:beta-glucosidase